jgi:hypothetical protein
MAKAVIDYDKLLDGQTYDEGELGRQIAALCEEELLLLHEQLIDVHMNAMIEMRNRELGIIDEDSWEICLEICNRISDSSIGVG